MAVEWEKCPKFERQPGLVSGSRVVEETRVPVRALFENLEDGVSINDLLEWFQGVARRQVESVLECASAPFYI
ncbi:MAG: DUF433 domain-containing protein [Acidobacteria bacterium]|nr:DUF433 domain-containing protein [Acidobacteriota bacterium]